MRKITITTIIATIVILCGCTQSPTYRTCAGSIWATAYHITYHSDKNLDDSIMAVLRDVEMSLSPFADRSLISKINRGESMMTDTLLRKVFVTSKYINRLSSGVFDPTVAPLVNMWGFGYKNGTGEPTKAEIDSVLAHVGIDRCYVVADTMVKASPYTEFNFSAITKGFGCDLVGEMFKRNGCSDYMVEIGGEIALSGNNPQGEAWHIQIDAPVENMAAGGQAVTIIEITDLGIASSGNYRNFRQTDNGKVWHTISPLTGYPAITTTLSATILAPDCMKADALATSCMAMQPEEALKMIEQIDGASALLVVKRDNQSDTIMCSKDFPIIR